MTFCVCWQHSIPTNNQPSVSCTFHGLGARTLDRLAVKRRSNLAHRLLVLDLDEAYRDLGCVPRHLNGIRMAAGNRVICGRRTRRFARLARA